MTDRDLDADIAFHEFARRRAAAHDKYANQEVAYRRSPEQSDDADLTAPFTSMPEMDDEVIASLVEHHVMEYDAVAVSQDDDDVALGPVGVEIDELDDLNL